MGWISGSVREHRLTEIHGFGEFRENGWWDLGPQEVVQPVLKQLDLDKKPMGVHADQADAYKLIQ